MHEFFSGKLKEFWSGSIIGFIAGFNLLWDSPVTWGDYFLAYTIKFVGVIVFSLTSGVLTVLAKDLYQYKIKRLIFRKKKKDIED